MKHHKPEQPAALGVNSVLRVGGTIGALQFQFLLDSGAAVSLIQRDKLPESTMHLMEQAAVSTVGANGLPVDVVGQISLSVCICGTVVKQTFLVVEELTVEALLGADFLDKHKAVLDFAHHRLTLGNQPTSISAVDKLPQAPLQVLTVAIGSDVEVPGRSVVTASGHLERVWRQVVLWNHTGTQVLRNISCLHIVSAQCGRDVLNYKSRTVAPCQSSCFRVQRLGYLISGDGVAVDSSKVEAVTSYPQPMNVKELRGFLGLVNYYRRFVQGFASIAHPLYQLTSKNAKGFDWTPHCQQAFDQLKQLLVSPPILVYIPAF